MDGTSPCASCPGSQVRAVRRQAKIHIQQRRRAVGTQVFADFSGNQWRWDSFKLVSADPVQEQSIQKTSDGLRRGKVLPLAGKAWGAASEDINISLCRTIPKPERKAQACPALRRLRACVRDMPGLFALASVSS